jgi:hypothetical protein
MNTNRRNLLIFVLAGVVLAGIGGFFAVKALWPELFYQRTGQGANIPINSASSSQVRSSAGLELISYSPYLRLSEGRAQPQTAPRVPFVIGQPLSPEEVAAITGRLPNLPEDASQQTEFVVPPDLLPPPLTGETIELVFPQAQSGPGPQVDPSGPLQVLRYSPEGEVATAPFVSITFNQAMVPLGTLAALSAVEVPVQIEPDLPGVWRWLGTKTLTFEAASDAVDRLPKATHFRVTVPAGVQSMNGGTLAETVSWVFSTPPPVATTLYPYDNPQPRDPLFFIAFDQRIDPASVLETIAVSAGGQAVGLRLADASEVEDDEAVNRLAKATPAGRWLAFRASSLLPADTRITVTVGPGTPSAEGPRLTEATQEYSFSTYAPLRIEDSGCSWGERLCLPLSPFFIRFNNPIDTSAYTEEMLYVEPAIPGVSVNVYDNMLEISGMTVGRTNYRVRVDGDLRDIFGQTLGEDTTLTFSVGPAEALLTGPNQMLVTLDPQASQPVFSVYAINYEQIDVEIYAVQAEQWDDFTAALRAWDRSDELPTLPGSLVSSQVLRPELAPDTLTQVDINLSGYLEDGSGHFIVVVEPPAGMFNEEDRWQRRSQTIVRWVQITQIGLDAFFDYNEMVVWATALKDGAPLAEVVVSAANGNQTYLTDAEGIARFTIPGNTPYLVVSQGQDEALLPRSPYGYWDEDGWTRQVVYDRLQWFVFDDRQIYRPGEEVHLKGWMRRIGGGKDGDVSLVGNVGNVSYEVFDPQGNQIGNGQAEVNAFGGFDFVLTLPEQANLGGAWINLYADGSNLEGSQATHSFQIQEFRRPEFEVTARNETSGPYFTGGSAVVAVQASYYAGDPLPNAAVTWTVSFQDGSYAPPNWPDFTFGSWEPWWWRYEEMFVYEKGDGGDVQTFSGVTDAGGTHYLQLDFDGSNGPKPLSVSAEATVEDVNRQAWSSRTSLLVHPASFYIGLRSERYFVERGEPLKVDFIVTDLDGNPIAGQPIEIRAARLEWKYNQGEWAEQEVDTQVCEQTVSASDVLSCTFSTEIGGTYRITAVVTDGVGRTNESSFTRWVSGGQLPPNRNIEQEELTLIPDQETYQPGETAAILVQSPFSPAEGLLTVTRSGILYTQRFDVVDGSATVYVPIQEWHTPNVNIQVDLVGSAPRLSDEGEPLENVPDRPAYASGQATLNVPPLHRTLEVQVTPAQSELAPGGETTLNVSVRDAAGQPSADSELAVVVVDEAVLALTGYSIGNPMDRFYEMKYPSLEAVYSRFQIVLVDPLALAEQAHSKQTVELMMVVEESEVQRDAIEAPAAMPTMMAADEAAGAGNAQAEQPILLRSDFNPLAHFTPSGRTDANGQAVITVKLPDNLTRYRVMVVAVDSGGQQFGVGESTLTARLPLMVRPSAPRFLNFGDQFELPIVLQNQTDSEMQVSVALRAANLELTEFLTPSGAGMLVSVPPHDRVEVRFPGTTRLAGTAVIQVAAVAGEYADAATITFPVYTPATSEAFATYGVVDEGAVAQPVLMPEGVFPQYGGLEINTSSTALQALTDALLYLVEYPFECSEQLASRILAVAALRDVLTAFEAEGLPEPAALQAQVAKDIERLQGMQNEDGSFPYWRKGEEDVPFNTIHAAHALVRAQAKGFDVPAAMLNNALSYLRVIEEHFPEWYSKETRWTISAYALYVRNLAGERDASKAQALLNEAGLEKLSMETIGWLWPVISDANQLEAIRRHVGNRVVETAGAANFTTDYDDQAYLLLSSDRRTDAILLEAMMGDQPDSDLIPKIVNGLLANRVRGQWGSTQENVFVLLALDRYFNTYEAQTPDFVARLWLGDTYAGAFTYQGRTTERGEVTIPMSYVISETASAGGMENLVVSKEGVGRLYYRLGLRYAPSDLNLPALDMGFVITRRYEAVDDAEDVWQDADGTWHIKAGARVRVVLGMVASSRRYHVALVDRLPAGLEIVNPALAISQSAPAQDGDPEPYKEWWWWHWTWYNHENLRDERVEAFATLLWEGVYEYAYIARATTPGAFIAPPAKAEEMYSPEVFGRTGNDWVVIEP